MEHALLNATEFFDEALALPQYVVAWARGVSLRDYVKRLSREAHHSAKDWLRASLGTLGWWRRDWFAYRRASRVLAVSTPLHRELREYGVDSALLYPCTATRVSSVEARDDVVVRLITAAVHLDDPRKQVVWMLDALKRLSARNISLTLVGEAGRRTIAAASHLEIPVHFTGSLARDDVLRVMREHDAFLFASALDDWGYVATEAMASGLAVVAPDCPPFDEILGSTGARFSPRNSQQFAEAVQGLLPRVRTERTASLERASDLFSAATFVHGLRAAVIARRDLQQIVQH